MRIDNADDIDIAYRFCTCCSRRLKGKVAWLEFSTMYGQYFDTGIVDENDSQGLFPFSMSCARKIIKAYNSSVTGA